jgi:hypothetical protein
LDTTSSLILDAPLAALAPTLTTLTALATRCELSNRRYLIKIVNKIDVEIGGKRGVTGVPRVLLLFQYDATGNTVLRLLVHYRYTVVTLLLHYFYCCYAVVDSLLHCCYTVPRVLLLFQYDATGKNSISNGFGVTSDCCGVTTIDDYGVTSNGYDARHSSSMAPGGGGGGGG